MKHITFSRNKLKNYFLILTYFLIGVGVSNKIPKEILFIVLGIYLTVSCFHLKEMISLKKEHQQHKQEM